MDSSWNELDKIFDINFVRTAGKKKLEKPLKFRRQKSSFILSMTHQSCNFCTREKKRCTSSGRRNVTFLGHWSSCSGSSHDQNLKHFLQMNVEIKANVSFDAREDTEMSASQRVKRAGRDRRSKTCGRLERTQLTSDATSRPRPRAVCRVVPARQILLIFVDRVVST